MARCCFSSLSVTLISNISSYRLLWAKLMMHVNWKALLSLGIAFWGLSYCGDLLGESTWRKCSHNIDDILTGQYNEISRLQEQTKGGEGGESQKQKMNWPVLLWNVCAFLCSLVFCSVLKSMSWVVWKVVRVYNVFRNRKLFTEKVATARIVETETESDGPKVANCKVLFKNQTFEGAKDSRELEETKREKSELAQQLMMAQKENLTARQQIEEYKLETFMMKEKLARTANTLKENLKYKDFANANQELIAKKALNLEVHLKEVSRDRDLLRSKLSSLEKNYSKLEDRLKMYEKQGSESTNLEQYPEKDTADKPTGNEYSQQSETDADICKFQQKIMELHRNIGGFEPRRANFETNSKISVDLDDSSLDTSKDLDSEEGKKADINVVKQNLLNYNAYKAQMMRPKLKLSDIKERIYSADTTGSSSDDNSGPHRIISSTIEFQNFLKNLTSNSKSSVDFNK